MADDALVPGEFNPVLFGGKSFRHIFSLGGNCEPSHHLRRTGRYQTHGLFDWLVTPLDSIGAILADDGARLATRFMAANEGTSARCAEYGVLYHHEFPRGPGDVILFDRAAIVRCRRKLRHKMRGFIDICSGDAPILFIRVWPQTDLPWDRLGPDGEVARSQDLNALVATLQARFPRLDFRLLVAVLADECNNDFSAALDPRIAIKALPRQSQGDWTVADEDWDVLLDQVVQTQGAGPAATLETLFWF